MSQELLILKAKLYDKTEEIEQLKLMNEKFNNMGATIADILGLVTTNEEGNQIFNIDEVTEVVCRELDDLNHRRRKEECGNSEKCRVEPVEPNM